MATNVPGVPSLMKGIQISEFGGPEVLKLNSEIPVPQPSSTQVLFHVIYAGVNPVDTYIQNGNFMELPSLPFTPGKDGAGVVVAVGDNISNFKVGDRVYTQWGIGTYAEYALADEWNTHKLHDSISYKEGAAIGISYFTAYRVFFQKSRIEPGETLLVHGASGAVGLACVQMARAYGMIVLGTAGTTAGMDLVKHHGAHHVFNHNEEGYIERIMEKTQGKGVNIIAEMVSNLNLENDLKLMAQNGRIAIIGNKGPTEVDLLVALLKEISIFGVALPKASKSELDECSAFIFAGQEQGWLKPEVGQEYSLSEVQTAHTEVIVHTGGSRGNIVIKI